MKINNVIVMFTSEASSIIKQVQWMAIPHKDIGVLKIFFKTNNSMYKYRDVPFNVFKDFVQAESIGSYFNKNIKNEYYVVKEEKNELE